MTVNKVISRKTYLELQNTLKPQKLLQKMTQMKMILKMVEKKEVGQIKMGN